MDFQYVLHMISTKRISQQKHMQRYCISKNRRDVTTISHGIDKGKRKQKLHHVVIYR